MESSLISVDMMIFTKEKATIEGITLDKLNSFMKTVYNGKNRIQVIMEGVQAE